MKPYKPNLIFFIIFTLLLGLITSCSFTSEKKLKTKGFTMMYKAKTAAGYEVASLKLRPVQLSEGQVRQQMRSIIYEEMNLFGKKKTVFSLEETNRFARLIAKGLNRSTPNKVVYFEIECREGTTVGIVFVNHRRVNWKFTKIQGGVFSTRSFKGWGGTRWRLVPASSQQFYFIDKALGSVAQENWITIPLPKNSERQAQAYQEPEPKQPTRKQRRVQTKRSRKQASATTRTKSADTELEKKLQFLKGLYENNLVDEEEYNRKRKELLDTYL
jgi:hypothetical protein